jgi:hypothetical protein
MPDSSSSDAPRKRAAASGSDRRDLGRVVRRYLGALETEKAAKGRKRGLEAVQNRLLKIDELLVTADPLSRLHLTQERIDLHAEIVRVANGSDADFAALEADFVKVAKTYGEVSGITFAAWRRVGVDSEVLERAGIARTSTNHKGEARKPAEPAPEKAAPQPLDAPSKTEGTAPAEEDAPAKAARPVTKAKAKKARKAPAKTEAPPNPNSASMRRKRMAAGSEAAG